MVVGFRVYCTDTPGVYSIFIYSVAGKKIWVKQLDMDNVTE